MLPEPVWSLDWVLPFVSSAQFPVSFGPGFFSFDSSRSPWLSATVQGCFMLSFSAGSFALLVQAVGFFGPGLLLLLAQRGSFGFQNGPLVLVSLFWPGVHPVLCLVEVLRHCLHTLLYHWWMPSGVFQSLWVPVPRFILLESSTVLFSPTDLQSVLVPVIFAHQSHSRLSCCYALDCCSCTGGLGS